VVVLVVEGLQGSLSPVELQLAARCVSEGRGLVLAANKLDRVLDRVHTLLLPFPIH
jgi:hypothetical protein